MRVFGSLGEVLTHIGDRRVMVFGGFSGMGYAEPDRLDEDLRRLLLLETRLGAVVVSGATSDGIGRVYPIAKELGIPTYGIVSDDVAPAAIDPCCDHVLRVQDPQKTRQTLDVHGHSEMVNVAEANGVLYYFGGGDVAVSEVREAQERGIPVVMDLTYEPDPAKLAAKQAKTPSTDPTPLRTYARCGAD